MARVNIYLPDDLARRAREAGLNVSGVAQEAIESQLRIRAVNDWLASLRARPPLEGPRLSNEELVEIMDEVSEEMGRAADKYVDPQRYQAEVDAVRTDRS
jgi:hypothetical protein